MEYAIVCNFNIEMENEVRKIWKEFKEAGIGKNPGELKARPHITFTLHTEVAPEILTDTIDNMMIKEMPVQLASFGAFTTKENGLILFLSVTPSFRILSLHKQLHDYFNANRISFENLYAPGNWIPHCTLSMDMDRDQFNKGVEICLKHNQNIKGKISRISVIEFIPFKELMSRKLIC